MQNITAVDTFLVDLPTIRPHVLSMATMHRQTIVIVVIHCSDGIVGVGEGTTIGGLSYGDESPEGIKLAIDTYIAPVLRTCDPARIGESMTKISRAVVGNHFAKSAVETALLDAMGKRLGLPVSELLGGRQRDALPVAWTLASGDTAKDIEESEQMLSLSRHNIFKLKIGKRRVDDDVAHVAAIKKALGNRASVRVDVNQAWDEASAARGLAMLEDVGVDLVEQPLARANRAGMARLASRFVIPIMADEALHGPEDAFDIAAHAAADVFAVKISPSGGRVPLAAWPRSPMLRVSGSTAGRCLKQVSVPLHPRMCLRPLRRWPGVPSSSDRSYSLRRSSPNLWLTTTLL